MVTALEKEQILLQQRVDFDLLRFDYILTVESSKFLKRGMFFRFSSFLILPLCAFLETFTNLLFTSLCLFTYTLGFVILPLPLPIIWIINPQLFKRYWLYYWTVYSSDRIGNAFLYTFWLMVVAISFTLGLTFGFL